MSTKRLSCQLLNHTGITALPCVLSNSTNSNYRTEMGVGFLGFQSKNLTKKGRPEHRSILKTARSWTFLSSKEPSSKPLVIIKAAPFPSLVGYGVHTSDLITQNKPWRL